MSGLSWTSDELYEDYGPNGPDEDDLAVLNEAMERDMGSRDQHCTDGASNEEHDAAIEFLGQCPWCGKEE